MIVAIPMCTRWASMPLCATRSMAHRTSSSHRQVKHFGSLRLDARTSLAISLGAAKATRHNTEERSMSTEAVQTQLTRAIRPFLSLDLTQADQIRSTEMPRLFSLQLVKRSGLSKFDDPQGLSRWWLDHVCSSINRVTSRGIEGDGLAVSIRAAF